MAAEALDVVCLPRNAAAEEARKAGAALGKLKGEARCWCWPAQVRRPVELTLGVVLRAYAFTAHKTERPRRAARSP